MFALTFNLNAAPRCPLCGVNLLKGVLHFADGVAICSACVSAPDHVLHAAIQAVKDSISIREAMVSKTISFWCPPDDSARSAFEQVARSGL